MKQTEETQRAKKGMETDMAAMKNKLSFANNIHRQVIFCISEQISCCKMGCSYVNSPSHSLLISSIKWDQMELIVSFYKITASIPYTKPTSLLK